MSRTDIQPPRTTDALGLYSQVTVYVNQGNKILSQSSSSRLSLRVIENRVGNVNPNFFHNQSIGIFNAPNAFNYVRNTEDYVKGYTTYVYGSTLSTKKKVTLSGCFGGIHQYNPERFPDVIVANLNNLATLKIREKMKDAADGGSNDNSQFNLAVFGAEAPESFRMIRDNIVKIRRAYAAVRRGQFKRAATVLGMEKVIRLPTKTWLKGRSRSQAIADFWLELQLGWRPLISDISGAISYIDKHSRKGNGYALIRFAAVNSASSSRVTVSGSSTLSFTSRQDQKIVIYLRRSSDVLRTASSLGLTNPFFVGWELVPLSFLLDYAVKVGSWLSQFDSTLGYEFYSGTRTGFFEGSVKEVVSVHRDTYDGVYDSYHSELMSERRSVICTRTALLSTPFAILPGFKNPMSYTHAANAVSLLISNLKGK